MTVAEPVDRISHCTKCKAPLPLRRAIDKEPAHLWECAKCGTVYRGTISLDATIATLSNVRCVKQAAAVTVPAR